MLAARDDGGSSYNESLRAEVERLRESSAREIDEIRVHGREVFDRENRTLREARQHAIDDAERLRSQLSEVEGLVDDLRREKAELEGKHATALGEARNEVSIKAFEVDRLLLSAEERAAAIQKADLEVERLRQKCEVLTTQYYEMERSLQEKIAAGGAEKRGLQCVPPPFPWRPFAGADRSRTSFGAAGPASHTVASPEASVSQDPEKEIPRRSHSGSFG